ncbi:MAG: SLBB domain-containing protein [Acidobacteriota bacterium]
MTALRVIPALLLACGAYAQQQLPAQLPPQCESRPDDPRCQAVAEQLKRETATTPYEQRQSRVPVIRDQAPPFERLDKREPAATGAEWQPPPPEPPTEFQEFVEQSTGRLLPLFGRDLFGKAPSTFAPADRVPVTSEYTLGPGDQLLVRGWGQIDLNVAPVVDRSGAVYIPQVGELNVAGLPFAKVQDYVKSAVSRVYRNFDLSVNLGQLRSIQVFVVGHARQPGAYTISSLSTLVNAIFAAGGPDSHGSMRRIRLTRPGRPTIEFDLYDLLLSGDKSADVRLLPGDVIHIPPVGPQVAVTGSVNTPAIYELKKGETLADVLETAGGLTPVASRRTALIERIEDSTRRVVEARLDGSALSETPLRDGDVVKIRAIVPRFENTVTLRGNVADPVRVPWRPGMRIRDLIPEREALLTRDYWRNRNRLTRDDARPTREPAQDAQETKDARDIQERRAPALRPVSGTPGAIAGFKPESNTPERTMTSKAPESPLTQSKPERPLDVNWSYAVIERQSPKDLKTTLMPFHLGRAIIDRDESENIPLEAGDVVTIFSTSDVKVPQNLQTRYVRLEGEFVSAGVYSVRPGETLRQLVERAGGLTPQAFLFGSEFVRQASRAEQQQRLDDLVNSLERQASSSAANIRGTIISAEEAAAAASQVEARREFIRKMRELRATGRIVLDLEPHARGTAALPELPLEDGDVFTVPSRPAFVNVVGAVYNGTSFVYQEDKRLGDYLREAGGPTRTGDSRHTFLIRADGSVVSQSWTSDKLTHSFDDLRLNPGDSVVVPEQLDKNTFLKSLKDWSQVFAQFGLGAAAVNVLR